MLTLKEMNASYISNVAQRIKDYTESNLLYTIEDPLFEFNKNAILQENTYFANDLKLKTSIIDFEYSSHTMRYIMTLKLKEEYQAVLLIEQDYIFDVILKLFKKALESQDLYLVIANITSIEEIVNMDLSSFNCITHDDNEIDLFI